MICHGKNRFGTAHHTPLPCHDRIPDKNSSFSLQESKYDFANPLSRKDALSRSALCAQWFYACPNQPHARDLRLSTVRCQANDKLPPSGQILTPCSQAAQVFILLQLARLSVKHFLACVRSAAALRLSVG